MFKTINYIKNDGIATIELNTPENLNALEGTMLEELADVFEQVSSDSEVDVVVISGKGKGFSAGGDIGTMHELLSGEDEINFRPSMDALSTAALKLRRIPKPVIASVHGPAAGAGFNLALLCDFRIAADNATFLQAFVNLGLIPDMGGVYSLVKNIGVAKTTELTMLGKPVKAKEAKELGLVTEVVAMDELEEKTLELANILKSLPSKSLENMKSLINNAAFGGLEGSLSRELEYQVDCAKTEDFKEGVSAFVEKRKPNFKGE